ncbi:MerR family transcriptional regulator [Pediococcus claussenii]|uniref:Transcriptional regulator n=1 Tax=Pediococcus claussenii (strain ATCC BAA-344 / DSM 14800 / JCM 18046 / KCTC 3811 / LMG 21948 / P06) TaxID=701521 RepID=G8PA74_PEDCP|nr:MerR family transcriptional regulator [Pediococcus claussenii]AEV94513.1 putative transcriptional regulator [Pediococcus claussenii ATCC BAA-344]KRN19780.1 hypothetical protein IV79_GL001068 [Pediococcus claussenii]
MDMESATERFKRVKFLLNQEALLLSIGDVAKAIGSTTRQLRYWKKKGYINGIQSGTGQRKFNYPEVIRAGVIQGLIEDGYTLSGAVKRSKENDFVFKELRELLSERFNNVYERDDGVEFDLGEIEDCEPNQHLFVVLRNNGKNGFRIGSHD